MGERQRAEQLKLFNIEAKERKIPTLWEHIFLVELTKGIYTPMLIIKGEYFRIKSFNNIT